MRTVVEMNEKPGPVITDVNAPFFEACAKNQFILQRCASCGTWIYYPREACPECLSTDLRWQAAEGSGTVETFTFVHRPESSAFFDDVPIAIVVVELVEGPRMIAGYSGSALPQIGQRVEVGFVPRKSTSIPVFRPSE